jgi:hypothetical protein
MAELDTKAALVAAVEDWLVRPDLAARIPTFIRLFEAHFNRESRWLKETYTIKNAGTPLTVDDTPFVLPEPIHRPLAVWSLSTPNFGELEILTVQEWRKLLQQHGNAAGTPTKAVVSFDSSTARPYLTLYPAPSGDWDIDIDYVTKVTPLDEDDDTNPVLLEHPDAYLYGTLAEAAPYIQHDDRLAMWVERRDQIIKRMNFQREEIERGARPMRVNLKRF